MEVMGGRNWKFGDKMGKQHIIHKNFKESNHRLAKLEYNTVR